MILAKTLLFTLLVPGADAIFLYAAALWAVFHAVVLLYEEPILEKLFGETYRLYRESASRWNPWLGRKTA